MRSICGIGWVLVALGVVTLRGVDLQPGAAAPNDPNDPGKLRYHDLVEAVKRADDVIVWEGLPRQVVESDSFAKDKAARPDKQIDDQFFYPLPLPFSDGERRAASDAIVGTKSNFKGWSGFKFCGGFHADYAVEWRKQGVILAQALICFGCGEGRFLVKDQHEQVDLSESGRKNLMAVLHLHKDAMQRPKGYAAPPAPAR